MVKVKRGIIWTELKNDWFVKDSFEKTLKNMIEVADLSYLKTVTPDVFERQLITEVETISPYRGQEQIEVKNYIHENLNRLYRYAQELATKMTRVEREKLEIGAE